MAKTDIRATTKGKLHVFI